MDSKNEYLNLIISYNEESNNIATGRKYNLSISNNNSLELLIEEISGEVNCYIYNEIEELLGSELLSDQSFDSIKRQYFRYLDELYFGISLETL